MGARHRWKALPLAYDVGNHRIRRISPEGIITTFAGTGVRGFSGDGGPAIAATFNEPAAVVFDSSGNLFIADTENNRIRKISCVMMVAAPVMGAPGVNPAPTPSPTPSPAPDSGGEGGAPGGNTGEATTGDGGGSGIGESTDNSIGSQSSGGGCSLTGPY